MCQDVAKWLLNTTYPDTISGKMQIVINSTVVEDYTISLESQTLNEDKYYYNYSKDEVLASPSDLLGAFISFQQFYFHLNSPYGKCF